jgi:hypothetical protein
MMTDHSEKPTPTLAAAKRRRADLHHALVDVEVAISGPAAGRMPQWAAEVLKRLAILRDNLNEHIEAAERPGGLYDEIINLAPHLSGKTRRLREEHPVLRDRTAELLERLESRPIRDEQDLHDTREDVQRLLGKIVHHRQMGADLIWEAYNLDIGGHES